MEDWEDFGVATIVGNINVLAGAQMTSSQGVIGSVGFAVPDLSQTAFGGASVSGMVLVSGAGSTWTNGGDLIIGQNNVDPLDAAGALVPSSVLAAISSSGTLSISDGGLVSVDGLLALAEDVGAVGTINIGTGGLSGTLNAAGIVGGTGEATVNFNHIDDMAFAPPMSGALAVNQMNDGMTTLSGANTYAGTTTISAGTLKAGTSGAFSPNSDFVVTGGTFDANGLNETVRSLANSGMVATKAKGGSAGTVLTVAGNYMGDGGTVALNTVLGEDDSATDQLVINGDTSGTSLLRVVNAGGSGAQTVDGIKVIDVGGMSSGAFSLLGDFVFEGDQAIVAGAYAYRLFAGGISAPADGDWYLRSKLIDNGPQFNPGVPVFETYPQHLLGLNDLPTLQQRVGNRHWSGEGANGVAREAVDSLTPDGVMPTFTEGLGFWGRLEGSARSNESDVSTSSVTYDQNIFRLQNGLDLELADTEAGRLIGGVAVHYRRGTSEIASPHGVGGISTDGYGFGGTLTWYGNNGFYVDGQSHVTWYDSDLTSTTANRALAAGNDSFGYALSLEAGQRIELDNGLSLTPQAQLVYSDVGFDGFIDPFGARISLENGDSLRGRVGIALNHESVWTGDDGTLSRRKLYGIANLHYEFLDGPKVDVAGVTFANSAERPWGEIGVGGSYNWNDDKYALHAEGSVATGLASFGGSQTLRGTAGFRIKW